MDTVNQVFSVAQVVVRPRGAVGVEFRVAGDSQAARLGVNFGSEAEVYFRARLRVNRKV